jgi:hypothetical protein
MIAEDLRSAVVAVPGVAYAEVVLRDGAIPVVRVWTDGSRADGVVHTDVSDILAIHGYLRPRQGADRTALEARINDSAERIGAAPLGASRVIPLPPTPPSLAKLVIEENGDSVIAIASDSSGRTASAVVGEGPDAFLTAVTAAVADLRGVRPSPVLVGIEDRFVAGVDVISVLIENGLGERYAGAAVVRGGRPYTVGRAVDAALANSL